MQSKWVGRYQAKNLSELRKNHTYYEDLTFCYVWVG